MQRRIDRFSSGSSSGGTAPYTYLWSNGKTTASNNGLSAGTYTATVTDSKGCTAKCSYTVTEPTYEATCSGTNVNCYGGNNGSASVTASGGTPSYTTCGAMVKPPHQTAIYQPARIQLQLPMQTDAQQPVHTP
ncbi:MAG: SprB repeat-containing protein [Bacteroidetes bacterium]|nr:SprB repeat-containing protein [Bacteroidota bacterium]